MKYALLIISTTALFAIIIIQGCEVAVNKLKRNKHD